ncbi:MAG: disulfide reductase [Candidatus Fischerbacteria bacterium RBG_13_37_8]|uniref:Disulfide reductase n=1 Tax=Candidatus Fischerbacteria bacterium RBG_13_37_8 TaxID=1817863 RepID=A0A1F5VQ65_9BACT|nr:MAG: disulfide reductase [Candidatus Fischerbacteria bacterium RBG_13_37_8]
MIEKEYAYFPGCSLKGTARGYEESLLQVFSTLGIKMKEIDDWNCCGATFYMSVDEMLSFTLSCRNMALADKMGGKMVIPCAACYLATKKTKDYVQKYDTIGGKIRGALNEVGLKYSDKVQLKHPVEILHDDYGLKELSSKVKKSIEHLKVVPYYGCQLVRPYTDVDDPMHPSIMDKVLSALGAKVVNYPLKTRCCGGSLMGTIEDIALRLNYILLKEAVERGGNCIAVLCPLCQFNLDCYQDEINARYNANFSIPVMYFTQVIGMALGLDKEKIGLQRSLVPADSLLR